MSDEEASASRTGTAERVTLFVTLSLFASAALAALLQPIVNSTSSPIRAPIIAPGTETTAVSAFAIMLVLLVAALAVLARAIGSLRVLPRVAWAAALISTPLFFAVYCLTKESTAVLEAALKSLGV